MLRIRLDRALPDDWIGLPACPGHIQGDRCPPSCLAHYRWGESGASAVLLALPLLPGCHRWSVWSNWMHDCGPEQGVSVALYRLDWTFRDPSGEPINAYTVVENDPTTVGMTVRVLADPNDAQRRFDRLVDDLANDCDCGITGARN